MRTLEGGLSHFELLVGAQAFWDRAAADLAVAKRRALVQAMTFEGDAAGLMVAADIAASGAADRRVLVDDYSRHVISDRFVHGPAAHLDPELRTEVREGFEQAGGTIVAAIKDMQGTLKDFAAIGLIGKKA